MENLFLHLLNLSITASYIILTVILLRFLLFKAPKWINCLLWSVVGLRLAIPFSIESVFSLIPSAEPIPQNIMHSQTPQIHSGITPLNNVINPVIEYSFAPDTSASTNPLQIAFFVASLVWLAGLCAILLWGIVSYLKLRKNVSASIMLCDSIYYCDHISSPFILGIIRPRIYLPSTIAEDEKPHVIAHEKAHLARLDHIWKPIGFLLLCVYWFNPLVWLAYILFCRDIEKACDEKVIREMQTEERKKYSTALLNCSIRRLTVNACPLAFGEVGVKSRVKAILNYKKPAFWLIIVAIILCIALAVTFLTMPIDRNIGNTDSDAMTAEQLYLMDTYPEYFGLDATNGLDVYVWQMAENSYSFGLLPSSDRNWLDSELLNLKGTNVLQMRTILATYDLSDTSVRIVPWQNPVSSYLPPYCFVTEGESIEEKRDAYVKEIENMLFYGELLYYPPIYDTERFDVDGDGEDEYCSLNYGLTSGVFTFSFRVLEAGANEATYHTTFISDWYKLSFMKGEDGVMRVQGINQANETHLFDISIVDGNVHLTENGVPIGEIATMIQNGVYTEEIDTLIQHPYVQYVDFENNDFSSIDKIIITDGSNGFKSEITNPKDISDIIDSIKTIEGKDPISDRGFYGFTYNVALYRNEEQCFSFGLFHDEGNVSLTCSLYETVNGHNYPCRYTLTNCSYEDIDRTLREYFP